MSNAQVNNMTDREMLELAAKAAGYVPKRERETAVRTGLVLTDEKGEITHTFWNPLDDDGDALRLAVKLNMELDLMDWRIAVRTPEGIKILQDIKDCREFAARRAIVRAAAEVGKSMLSHEEFVLMFPGRFEEEEVERAAAEIGRQMDTDKGGKE